MLNFDSSRFEQSILGNQLQPSSLETTTFHKSKSVARLDKISNESRLSSSDNNSPTATTTKPFSFDNIPTSTLGISSSTSSKPTTTTVRPLFSTMHHSTTSTDLKLFQTMANTQPFNNELVFLARNLKPNVNLNRSTIHPKNNLKPSVILSTYSPKSTKRKFNDSLLDDDLLETNIDQNSKISFKRPRMLDMHKIRSIILGNNQTSENVNEWKIFPKQEVQRSFHLPILTHNDYYTKPTIEELRSCFNEQGQCFVKQFTIGRKHYGSVTFQGLHMNLAGLDLNRLVEIDHRQVTVYPDDKDRPVEGEGFNCQAVISLIGVYPIDRSISNSGEEVTDPNRLIDMNYGKYLEEMTKKFHGQFVDYDVYTGTWIFQVEHF